MTSTSRFKVFVRLVLVPAMMVAVLGGCMFFDEIDRCLDRGGGWNVETGACELHEQPGDEEAAFEAPTTSCISS